MPEPPPMLEARGLAKVFRAGGGIGRRGRELRAVDGIDLLVARGTIHGLVGESGCGKSTVARLLMGLLRPSAGQVLLDGVETSSLRGADLGRVRRTMQMVFQDPYSSLNPAFTLAATLDEALSKVPGLPARGRAARAEELMARVGLDPAMLRARPAVLSGGQRQRVGIARALATVPSMLIADEPTSALDVSVQAQILDLFVGLAERSALSVLFISHDLSVIRYLCDRVSVMYLGRIVETGDTRAVLDAPRHPYTASLVASLPVPADRGARRRPLVEGDLPSPSALPPGCRFHPRCPFAQARCRSEEPVLGAGPVATAACHFPLAASLGTP